MKNLLFVLLLLTGPVLAEPFTYQGKLDFSGSPATGNHDFHFRLLDAGGAEVAIFDAAAIPVENGVFTAEIDFGMTFDGSPYWLEISVRPTGSGGYTTLSPAQYISATPMAQVALNDDTGNDWSLTGNNLTGTEWLGSSNDQPVEIRANGRRVLRVQHALNGSIHAPNILAGAEFNEIAATDTYGNSVVGATVAGGGGNPAINDCVDGTQTCVNRVTGSFATVSGGWSNMAGFAASVGGGVRNVSSEGYATVGGGWGNIASGLAATVPGGTDNQAGGHYSLAAGRRAKARDATASGDYNGDEGTFVWADSTNADFVSTGPNQFLVRASGGMGVGTNTPEAALHIKANSTAARPTLLLEEQGNDFARLEFASPDNATRVWHIAGAVQSTGQADDRLNFLHSESGDIMSISGDGKVGVGTTAPANPLHVRGNLSGWTIDNYVMQIENTSTASDADGLAIVLGTASPDAFNNYISFYHDGGNILHGSIEGSTGGGLYFTGTSADFAEYLPAEADFAPGTVVGLKEGRLVADVNRAEKVLVISTNPIVVGNNDMQENNGKALAALLGQVPVKVVGEVAAGDWLLATDDNRARALKAGELAGVDLRRLVGKALSADENGQATVMVGLPPQEILQAALTAERERNTLQAERIHQLTTRLAEQQQQLAEQNEKLARLEQQQTEIAQLKTLLHQLLAREGLVTEEVAR